FLWLAGVWERYSKPVIKGRRDGERTHLDPTRSATLSAEGGDVAHDRGQVATPGPKADSAGLLTGSSPARQRTCPLGPRHSESSRYRRGRDGHPPGHLGADRPRPLSAGPTGGLPHLGVVELARIRPGSGHAAGRHQHWTQRLRRPSVAPARVVHPPAIGDGQTGAAPGPRRRAGKQTPAGAPA